MTAPEGHHTWAVSQWRKIQKHRLEMFCYSSMTRTNDEQDHKGQSHRTSAAEVYRDPRCQTQRTCRSWQERQPSGHRQLSERSPALPGGQFPCYAHGDRQIEAVLPSCWSPRKWQLEKTPPVLLTYPEKANSKQVCNSSTADDLK